MSKVAVVDLQGENVQESFNQALKLIGSISDLNTAKRSVVVKVGVFDHRGTAYTTVDVAGAIVNSFSKAPKIFVAESDNYRGTGSERLQIWKSLFSERIVPFNLSEDTDTKEVDIAGEKIGLSHILFKPNVLVSSHILRVFEKGSVLKNLLGLTPDRKKARFHRLGLERVLLDLYEAVGGVDLAVLDGTYAHGGVAPSAKKIVANVLLVGRDAVAVEAVGASLVGMNPEKMPIIREAVKRGLGEGNIDEIKIVGASLESIRERFAPLLKPKKRKKKA